MVRAVKILPVIMSLILFGVAVYYRKNISMTVSQPEILRTFILSYENYAIPIFLILCTIRSVFLLPAGAYAIVAGMTFGVVPGMILNCTGVTLSAVVAFFISRISGKSLFSKIAGRKFENIERKLKNSGTLYILESRMLPVFPFDAVSYASGLTDIKMKDFIIGTFFGSLPGSFVYSYLGSSIYDVHSKKFFVSVCMVVVISLIPLIYINIFKKG